jgi:hypothetical protein
MPRAEPALAGLLARIRRSRARDPRLFAVRAALSAVLLSLLLFLCFGPHPWSEGVAERVREGRPIRPIDYARTWGFWAAAANALIVSGLLATVRGWIGPARAAERTELRSRPMPAWARVLLAGALATSAILAWPRLTFSWWDDEEYAVRRYIDGAHVAGAEGLRFERIEWRDTFWDDREANNHVPQSVLSRLSLSIWRFVARPELPFADERAVRFPMYLAGIASVAMTGFFLHRLGFVAAGVGAAWLLALHPWHIRYASEARGYALLLLLVPASWVLLVDILERGTWRRWIAYGLVQTVLLWTHASMIHQLAVTNLIALVLVWRLRRDSPQGLREQMTRLLVTNLASAGLFAQLMLSNLVQVLRYLESWQGEESSVPALREVGAHLLAGVGWQARDPHYVSVGALAGAEPTWFAALLAFVAACFVAGTIRLLRAGVVPRLLLPALLLPALLLYLVSELRGDRFFSWYVLFALPGLASVVSAGATWALSTSSARSLRFGLCAVMCVAGLGMFAWGSQDARTALRAGSVVPSRESVLLTRPTLDPSDPANASIITASFSRPAAYYDPLGRWVDDVEQLQAFMAEADAAGQTLYMNWGRPDLAAQRATDLVDFVVLSGHFEEVATLWGFEKRGKRLVYRYRRTPGTETREAPGPANPAPHR